MLSIEESFGNVTEYLIKNKLDALFVNGKWHVSSVKDKVWDINAHGILCEMNVGINEDLDKAIFEYVYKVSKNDV